MPADIRSVGPGKLAVFGQGIADLGSQLLQNELLKQRLAEERKLQLEPALIQKIVGHPLQADDLIKAAGMMGIDLSGMKPSDQDIYQQVGQGIQAAKDPTQVPTDGGILSAIQQARPEAIEPTIGTQASPSVFSGQTGKFTLPSAGFGPAQRPEIQSLLDAAAAKKQSLLQDLQAKSGAQTSGRLLTEHGFAPITNQDAANRAGLTREAQIQADSENLPTIKSTERGKSAAQTQGRLGVELSPDVVNAKANAAAKTSKAAAQAQFDVQFDPGNVLKRLDFNYQDAFKRAQANADVAAGKAAEQAKLEGANALRVLRQIKGLYDKVKTNSLGEASKRTLEHYTGTLQHFQPQAAELDRLTQAYAIQLARAYGFTGRVSNIEISAMQGVLPTSRTLQSVGDPIFQKTSDTLTLAPLIQAAMPQASFEDRIKAGEILTDRLNEFRTKGTWGGKPVAKNADVKIDPETGISVPLPR